MPDTRVSNRCCACYNTDSGGQAWQCRCRGWSAVVNNASCMKAVIPNPQCDQLLLPHLWSCYMLTLPALRPWWSWINPQTWLTFWSFMTILQNTSWHMWPPVKLQKLLLSFCGKDTSQSLEHWPSSWVTEGQTLKAMSSESFVSLWAYRRLELHLIMLTKQLMCMIGKLNKDWKVDWPKHLPELVHA